MIETERLYITDAVESDIYEIITLENHEDNRNFIWQGTFDEHKAEIEDHNQLLFIIKKKVDNMTIGFVLIRLDQNSNIFELRRIAISEKGVGFGRETMLALIKYAFEEKNTNRFWLDVYPDNTIGIKLYESLGMHCDGILRQNYKSGRGYLDQIIYSILRDEYFKK